MSMYITTKENDRFDGTIRLLGLSASGLRTAGLEYIAATIENNAQGIAIELCTGAERVPVTGMILDTMIEAVRGDLNAH